MFFTYMYSDIWCKINCTSLYEVHKYTAYDESTNANNREQHVDLQFHASRYVQMMFIL